MLKRENVFELVIQALKNNHIEFSDLLFREIHERFHRYKCWSKPKFINYLQLCQLRNKNADNWVTILQTDKIITYQDSIDACWHMNPFEDAVIVVTRNCSIFDIFYQKVNVFIYKQAAFSDVIIMPSIDCLKPNFDLFNVYGKDGTLITNQENLQRNDEIVCISKQELQQKSPKKLPSHIIMRYYPKFIRFEG